MLMRCGLAGFAGIVLFASPAQAQAPSSAARLEAWLCTYFKAPSDDLLASFPDYGLGPIQRTTTQRTDARGGAVEKSSAMVRGQAFKVTATHQERVADRRPYGYHLKIEVKGQLIWPTAREAAERLARVGKVRTDKELGETIAEAGQEPGGLYYFTASFSTEFQRLEIDWLRPQEAAIGQGFCA